MKTQTNNLKKIATACAALLIVAGSYSQPNAGNQSNMNLVSIAGLETFISLTEASVKYVAPSVPASEVFYAEFERLEMLAANTEASVKYAAPEVNDADVTSEMERMEVFAAATEASLKYEAPEVNDVTPEMERMECLAAATEASLKYKAPQVNEISETENTIQSITMFASNSK